MEKGQPGGGNREIASSTAAIVAVETFIHTLQSRLYQTCLVFFALQAMKTGFPVVDSYFPAVFFTYSWKGAYLLCWFCRPAGIPVLSAYNP